MTTFASVKLLNGIVMQVAKIIRRYGYDIEMVATQMGLTKSSLAKSISSTGNPSIGKLRQIAELVGCDLADFFEDERKHPKEDPSPADENTSALDRVKQIMKAQGLSVTELSKRMGVMPSSLSRTLSNGTCRVATLKLIADALGCDIKDITEEAPEEPRLVCPHCGKEIEASISFHARNV